MLFQSDSSEREENVYSKKLQTLQTSINTPRRMGNKREPGWCGGPGAATNTLNPSRHECLSAVHSVLHIFSPPSMSVGFVSLNWILMISHCLIHKNIMCLLLLLFPLSLCVNAGFEKTSENSGHKESWNILIHKCLLLNPRQSLGERCTCRRFSRFSFSFGKPEIWKFSFFCRHYTVIASRKHTFCQKAETPRIEHKNT